MPDIHSLETDLRSLAIHDPEYKAFREKTTALPVLGLRVPAMRTFVASQAMFREPINTLLPILNTFWHEATLHETMTILLLALQPHKRTLGKKEWNVIKTWIDRVENWEHSDNLSLLYSHLFERFPDELLPTLRRWNCDKNPWKQRASIVPLIYYASPKRQAPAVSIVLSLVEPLIPSKDKYVQKAVGWTLRECHTLYPTQTYTFLQTHIRTLAPESFSYATERLNVQQKNRLKHQR